MMTCSTALGPLNQALLAYPGAHSRYRFHVPGHAGQALAPSLLQTCPELWAYDLTELDGLDVLSEPEGCLAESQAQCAAAWGAEHSFYLVQGSTVGLQTAMLAALKPGDKVLVPRNAHRSVLSGLILTGAEPAWFLPPTLQSQFPAYTGQGLWGGLTAEAIEPYLQTHPDLKALVLSHPTYEGVASDIQGLAQLCRKHDVLLLVDEAHGALWPLSPDLPTSALELDPALGLGADAVVQSLHKTGGSLTQAALLHRPKGSRLEAETLQATLNTLQTTSPSYPLLASLEAAAFWLSSPEGQAKLQATLAQAQTLRNVVLELETLALLAPTGETHSAPLPLDPLKLLLHAKPNFVANFNGEALAAELETQAGLAYEACTPSSVLYLAQLGLPEQAYAAWLQAWQSVDKALRAKSAGAWSEKPETSSALTLPEMVCTPREAFFAPAERVERDQAVGQVAKQTIVHCPPGIPELLPGERIQPWHVPRLPAWVSVLR